MFDLRADAFMNCRRPATRGRHPSATSYPFVSPTIAIQCRCSHSSARQASHPVGTSRFVRRRQSLYFAGRSFADPPVIEDSSSLQRSAPSGARTETSGDPIVSRIESFIAAGYAAPT